MKRFLAIATMLCFSAASFAQTGTPARKQGYEGSIEIGTRQVVEKGEIGGASVFRTTHGIATKSGCFVGIGTGMELTYSEDLYIPVFLRAKYSFDKNWNGVSSFASVETGIRILANSAEYGRDITYNAGLMAGIDFSRYSLSLGYSLASGRISTYSTYGNLYLHHKQSEVFCLFALRF